MPEPHRHDLSAQILGEALAGGWGPASTADDFSRLARFDSLVPRKIGKARQSRTALLAPTLASMIRLARHPIGDWVATAHFGLDQPVEHESRRDVNALPAGI